MASSIGASPIQPVVDLGLGLGFANFLFAYAETSMEAHFNNLRQDPPQFLINAHKEALDLAGCNQYAPPGVRFAPSESLFLIQVSFSRVYQPSQKRYLGSIRLYTDVILSQRRIFRFILEARKRY